MFHAVSLSCVRICFCRRLTMSDQVDPDDRSVPSGNLAQANFGPGLGPLSEPWQVVSTLASEYGHAVRHALGKDRGVTSSGDVNYERKLRYPARISTDQVDSPNSSEQNKQLHNQQSSRDIQLENACATKSAVQAEVLQISSKIAARGPAKNVFLRFDFMTERDSRVCMSSCLLLCSICHLKC